MRDGFVSTKTFGRLHYLEAGSGEPLILMHSNGCSAHEFAGVFDALAETNHVFAWDMVGHGDSERIVKHHGIDMYADALVEFMDAMDIEAAHVLGVSVGGLICASLGHRHPSRVLSLLVVEAPFRSSGDWAKRWDTVERTFGQASQTLDQVAPRFRSINGHELVRWNIDREKAGVKTMIDVMWAMREYDATTAFAAVTAPTVIVFGDKGPAIATADAYREVRPDIDQIVLSDCGHFPMIDDPDVFSTTVKEFLASL